MAITCHWIAISSCAVVILVVRLPSGVALRSAACRASPLFCSPLVPLAKAPPLKNKYPPPPCARRKVILSGFFFPAGQRCFLSLSRPRRRLPRPPIF
ncbi:hypothetical protein BC940DRAFT_292995 [Gongronella butleri]|nr:hypothetical protein BC940DRAFT_292995 [Gongronella butleri]